MITQRDMEKILADVNRVFSNMNEELSVLKQRVEALEKPKTTTNAKKLN